MANRSISNLFVRALFLAVQYSPAYGPLTENPHCHRVSSKRPEVISQSPEWSSFHEFRVAIESFEFSSSESSSVESEFNSELNFESYTSGLAGHQLQCITSIRFTSTSIVFRTGSWISWPVGGGEGTQLFGVTLLRVLLGVLGRRQFRRTV